MEINTPTRPWVDSKGKVFSDEVLKEISKSWNAETWELFLQQTVDVERSAHEVLLDGYEKLLEEISVGIQWASCSVPQHVVTQIHRAICTLPPQQKRIVKMIYWGFQSEGQVSVLLNISQQGVHRSKKISLNKIKSLLENDVVTRSYLIGGKKNSALRNRSRDEQIKQVYAIDLNGSYIK